MAIGQLSLMLLQRGVWRNLGRVSKPTSWTSLAMGGFGSASIEMPGRDAYELVDYLSIVRLVNGTEVVWEGQVEDKFLDIQEAGASTVLQAFGLKKLLEETSLRRIWILRDAQWQNATNSINSWPKPSAVTNAIKYQRTVQWNIVSGRFDEKDPTRLGFHGICDQNGSASVSTTAVWAYFDGVTVASLLVDVSLRWQNDCAFIYESADGTTWTEAWSLRPPDNTGVIRKTNVSLALKSTTKFIALGFHYDNSAPVSAADGTDNVWYENLRILGATTTEDTTGALYGGTILTDVIAQVPGITAGVIETGSDFGIEAIDRYVRGTALSVVEEVAAYYYQREWAVWENAVLDWKTVNFDETHYTVRLNDLTSLHLEGSTEALDETTIVQYSGPTGITSEASVASTSQLNPYVKQGRSKDGLVPVSFAMTPITAAKLAAKLNQDRGSRPAVTGSLTIPIQQIIANQQGRPCPAFMLRAGRNIAITDLPKSEWFTTGRDGATHFHITSMQIDAAKGLVQLDLDGQTRRSDALLARLGAITKTITG